MDLAALRFLESVPAALAVGFLLVPRLIGSDGARYRWVVAGLALFRFALGFPLIWAIAENVMPDRNGLDPGTLARFASGTVVGTAWMATQAAAGAFAFTAFLRILRPRSDLDRLTLGFGLVVIATVSATGHAVDDSLPVYARLSFLLHTLAGLTWLGGLSGLVYVMVAAGHKPPALARHLAERWSLVAKTAMALVVLTGLVLAWENVGSFPRLLATVYGRLLAAKIAILCGILLIALSLVRYQSRTEPSAFKCVRYGYVAGGEALLGLGLLFLAGWIATITPASHDTELVWPLPYRISYDATWGLGIPAWSAPWWEGVGAVVLLLAAVAGLFLPVARTWRYLAAAAAGMGAVASATASFAVEAYPETYRDPTIPYTAESVERGYAMFQANCVACHGPIGEGNGPIAGSLRLPPANLTAPHVATHTLGDIFHWITDGIDPGGMPGFAAISEDDRWDLINFLIDLSNTTQSRYLNPKGVRQWLVAPDFTLQDKDGTRTSLEKLRGAPVVISFVDCAAGGDAATSLALAGAAVRETESRHVVVAKGRCPIEGPALVPAHPKSADLAFGIVNRSLDEDFSLAIGEAHFVVDRSGFIRARFRHLAPDGSAAQLQADLKQMKAEPVVEIPRGHPH